MKNLEIHFVIYASARSPRCRDTCACGTRLSFFLGESRRGCHYFWSSRMFRPSTWFYVTRAKRTTSISFFFFYPLNCESPVATVIYVGTSYSLTRCVSKFLLRYRDTVFFSCIDIDRIVWEVQQFLLRSCCLLSMFSVPLDIFLVSL